MAVETKKSLHLANRDAVPAVSTPAAKSFGLKRESVALVAISASSSVGSKYILAEIGSGDRLADIALKSDAIGTGAAANFGLYDTTLNGGAVVNASIFTAAASIAAAGSAVITPAAADAEKLIWELLGLASDPGKQYDIVATMTGAAVAGGNLAVRTNYVTF